MNDKLGPYIKNLMVTIIDKEQEQFVQNLALEELKRLNAAVDEFLQSNIQDDSEETKQTIKSEKKLLQEKENG